MKFLTLTIHAVRGTLLQRITIAIIAAIAILFLIIIFTVHFNAEGGVIRSVSIYGSKPIQGTDFPYILPRFAEVYTAMYFLAAMALSVIATAQIIPESINCRTFVLYLSKPISRRSIILAIFTGVTIAIAIVQGIFVAGIWIILTIKTGIWNWGMLLSMVPLVVAFSALYAFMIYTGFIAKSTGIVTGLALGHVLFFSHILSSQNYNPGRVFGNTIGGILQHIGRAVLPCVHELQEMTHGAVMLGRLDSAILLFYLSPCLIYLWLSVRIFRRMDM